MAFAGRFGSLMRQTLANSNTITPSSSPSIFNGAIRFMSTQSSKLFIGGLSYSTDDNSLKEAFSTFGDVTEARVITDRDTGRSRGFAFVGFANAESASAAMASMDGQDLHGRNIRVSYANERPPRGSGGSYGGGGGYSGGGGYGGGSGGGSYGGGREDAF